MAIPRALPTSLCNAAGFHPLFVQNVQPLWAVISWAEASWRIRQFFILQQVADNADNCVPQAFPKMSQRSWVLFVKGNFPMQNLQNPQNLQSYGKFCARTFSTGAVVPSWLGLGKTRRCLICISYCRCRLQSDRLKEESSNSHKMLRDLHSTKNAWI